MLEPGANLAAELAFLDGYLFRVMLEMLETEGADEAGLYGFYESRLTAQRRALSAYDLALFNYVTANFDKDSRRIVHAGIGVGTLAAALAMAGYTIAGVERDPNRFRAANRLRAALTGVSPDAVARHELIYGEFPAVLVGTTWEARDAVLIFTNCVAGWSEELLEQAIVRFFPYGDVILDTRLFGRIRDTAAERDALVEQIQKCGFSTEAIPGNPPDCYYRHIRRSGSTDVHGG